jgi:hypothetical protein
MKGLVCCALAWAALSQAAACAGECCHHCGCHANCSKVCRLVCETKKVPKTEYDCECEDFCVPGPSQCSLGCDECGHHKLVYTPTCARVRTRVKLVKREEIKEVQSYKWVVEDLCAPCARACAAADAMAQGGTDRAATGARLASHAEPAAEAPAPDGESRAGGAARRFTLGAFAPLIGRR